MKMTTNHMPIRGDFSFVHDEHTRSMLQDAYSAVESVSGGWDALIPCPSPGGFMFNIPERGSIREQINIALSETNTGGLHSGASYSYTMRQMQGIASLGWDQFATLWLNANAAHGNVVNNNNNNNNITFADIPMTTADTENICRICFDSLESNIVVLCNSISPDQDEHACCGHKYHRECIQGWITHRHDTCPACRATMVTIHPLLA